VRVLLDECLPKRIKLLLRAQVLSTVSEMGWAGKKNGELLRLAEGGLFDVFVTVDQNLQYQQNLKNFDIGIVLIAIPNNRYETLTPLVPKIQQAIDKVSAGQLVRVEETN
jgi:predicted nuclease of predicted toxin-antitoxin system